MDSHIRPVYTHEHTRTVTDVLCVMTDSHRYSPRGPKSPEQSTGRVSVLSPRTNVLICVLMDSHERHVCADGHTRTHTDSHRHPVHGRPVCADGHPRMSFVYLTDSPRGPKSPEQSTGRASERICLLMDSHRHPVCADGHTRTHTDVLCVLTDTHGRPVCADRQPRTATNI
ncbi:unnamed protein product, partial [Brassica rapa]